MNFDWNTCPILDSSLHDWDALDHERGQTHETHPNQNATRETWIISLLAYLRRRRPSKKPDGKAGRDGEPILGWCECFLVKRELMPPFHKYSFNVERTSQVLGNFSREFLDGDGRPLRKIKGKGIWGADSRDSWILVVKRISVAERVRRQGVGRLLFRAIQERVLQLARQVPRSVFTVADPSVMRSEAESHGFDPGLASQGFGDFCSRNLQRAERFWSSLGFVRMGNSSWVGWTRGVDTLGSVGPAAPPTLKRLDEKVDYDRDVDLIFGGPSDMGARRL
ncbi:hypothetical protein F4778DRAFT_779229 [Xylariomycetidae sp. FL2044]|nr:hypothetical protein F4778DRAFT_779229 [Xylariomycetidae sp. FL2044]